MPDSVGLRLPLCVDIPTSCRISETGGWNAAHDSVLASTAKFNHRKPYLQRFFHTLDLIFNS